MECNERQKTLHYPSSEVREREEEEDGGERGEWGELWREIQQYSHNMIFEVFGRIFQSI